MSKSDDSGMRLLPWACAGAGAVLLLALFGKRQARAATVRTLNNPNKLLKEITRTVPVRPVEVKQLKVLADETGRAEGEPIDSPLVLLLCPSIVARAVQEKSTRADRRVLGQVLRKIVSK